MKTKETLISLDQTIEKTIQEQPRLLRGIIEEWEKGEGSVVVEGNTLRVSMAVSCVIEPQVRDTVLLCVTGQKGYILALLERENLESAKITVQGAQNILLHSEEKIELDAKTGHLSFGHLETFADNMLQTGRRITTQGEEIITVADRKVENMTNRTVSVSGTDIRRVNEVQDHIKGTWVIHAKTYVKRVIEDIRIIAKRVLFS